MAESDTTKLVNLGHMEDLAQRVNDRLEELENDDTALRKVVVNGNTIEFYNVTDTTNAEAVYTVDFPEEIFLDQAGTTLVENFAWSAATYPGSTNPNLDGKTVLVLAVKGDKETNPTTKYSFVNLEKLIDTYTASDTSIVIDGYKVKVNIDPDAENMLKLGANGLKVDGSGKVDKVTGATTGNVALFDSDGGIANSAIVGADVLTKIANATADHIVLVNADGTIKDGGVGIATDAEVTAMLNEVMGANSGS